MTLEELGLGVPGFTAEYVRSRLDYDPPTGVFVWLPRPWRNEWNARYAGKRAGNLKSHGYWRISIDNEQYYASRLAWLWMTGSWPENEIDHINLNSADDRWENLREATHTQNNWNKGRTIRNVSGRTGVYWHKKAGKWHASGIVSGQSIHLGLFDRFDDAVAAREDFEMKHQGAFSWRDPTWRTNR